MESNKNDNNNGEDEHEQPQRSAQKRKFNQLTNDEDKPAEAAGQEDQECTNSKKNREEENDMDLELESLSREELIKLVQKQMAMTIETEAQKQLETAKKEAEERTKQAEEFSERIAQLEREKAELHEDLNKKMTEILEKSEELAEKANQINALLTELKESREQHLMPTDEQEMKIQLSLETWYDWLGFVPRHRLGQIIPEIGDRKFASIVQKFLHQYGEIMLSGIEIVAPYEEDPSGPHPRVRAFQNHSLLRFIMAEAQMPTNIKSFHYFVLRYFDQTVLNFMQKFQKNGLLNNVNLYIANLSAKDIVQPVLCNILPLINGIDSIYVHSAQLVHFYDAGNSTEIYEMNMKMMEETRILGHKYGPEILHATQIDLYCRWLYQAARADRKPRLLFLKRMNVTPIYLFIDRLKHDFIMAADPISFFIRINLPKAFQPQENICLDNGKTKERFLTKIEVVNVPEQREYVVLLISRYPLASTKKWIVENEKELLNLEFNAVDNDRTIYLVKELKVIAT